MEVSPASLTLEGEGSCSVATAISNQTTPVEELGLRLVGRHIFHNRTCLERCPVRAGQHSTRPPP